MSATFEQAWQVYKVEYPQLYAFACGMATMFPTTATVESDFSVLKWEKNSHRLRLDDLSLAGIMHSKQYNRLLL